MTHDALRATTNTDEARNMILAPGTIVAENFVIIRPLGGRAYLARDKVLQRDVALKFQKDGPDGRAALLAEADILARCDHPSIVPFYRTYASDPSEPAFYAMKAYPSTLSSTPSRHSSLVIRHCAEAAASALAYLHALSPPVAHGNIKPEHILLDAEGHAVLAGFGSARVVIAGDGDDAFEADMKALGQITGVGSAHHWRRAILIAAATALAIASATCIALSRGTAVGDEALSPVISATSATVLRTRLPPVTPDLLRRIPWYCRLMLHGTAGTGAEAEDFNSRLREFEDAHPDWLARDAAVWPGAVRTVSLSGCAQIDLAGVPSGFFRRGFFLGASENQPDECLIRPDTVLVTRGFWMARTELTRAQYAAVMRFAPAVAGHSARHLKWREGRNGKPLEIEGGDLPVGEDLDLADVERFIDRLNALCGLEGDRRFRLPTEAEWELACRAFVARPFEGEKKPGDAAWFSENSGGVPHPVAQKVQNPLGLFDMHGNLAEWCADAYGPLPDWAPFDPCVKPASNGAPRVVRGGSFRDGAAACDSNARASALPTDKGYAIRLVAFP